MHRRAAAGGSRGRSGSWAATNVLAGACKAHARTRMTPCSREPLSLIKGTWENRVSLPNLPVPLPALLPAPKQPAEGQLCQADELISSRVMAWPGRRERHVLKQHRAGGGFYALVFTRGKWK